MSCSLQPKTIVALLHVSEDQLASVSSLGLPVTFQTSQASTLRSILGSQATSQGLQGT